MLQLIRFIGLKHDSKAPIWPGATMKYIFIVKKEIEGEMHLPAWFYTKSLE